MPDGVIRADENKAARTALQPARSYSVPGGPLARDLGTVEVAKLAEIARGGPEDNPRS